MLHHLLVQMVRYMYILFLDNMSLLVFVDLPALLLFHLIHLLSNNNMYIDLSLSQFVLLVVSVVSLRVILLAILLICGLDMENLTQIDYATTTK